MNSPRILLTGGTGFIGSSLLYSLDQLGFEVMTMCRSEPNNAYQNITWLEADLLDAETYETQIAEFSPNIVVHLAWQGLPDYSLNNSLINLSLTIRFLSFVTRLKSCRKVIVAGSCWEYGNTVGECHEEMSLSPTSYFAWAKNSIRTWLELHCEQNKIEYVWLRIFYVYGPGQRPASIVPSILSSLINKEEPYIQNPFNANDYVYIDDVVNAFLISINKSFLSGTYNIGSGKSVRVLEILNLARDLLGNSKCLPYKDDRFSKDRGGNMDFWANICKSQTNLGWEPSVELIDGISRSLEFLNNN